MSKLNSLPVLQLTFMLVILKTLCCDLQAMNIFIDAKLAHSKITHHTLFAFPFLYPG